jgi:hypothetical protein
MIQTLPATDGRDLRLGTSFVLELRSRGLESYGSPKSQSGRFAVLIIGPDKRIKLMLAYPMTTGRNFDEILRVLDSMQLTAKHKVATPVNWKKGDDVIIVPAVSDDEAKQKYPGGWKTLKPYLRVVAEPK